MGQNAWGLGGVGSGVVGDRVGAEDGTEMQLAVLAVHMHDESRWHTFWVTKYEQYSGELSSVGELNSSPAPPPSPMKNPLSADSDRHSSFAAIHQQRMFCLQPLSSVFSKHSLLRNCLVESPPEIALLEILPRANEEEVMARMATNENQGPRGVLLMVL